MWRQICRLGLIVVLALGIAGAFAAPGTVSAPKTIDDLLADVASLAPGFGGMFVDPDQDTLYVYLMEDTPVAVATLEAALTAVFGAGAPKQSRLVVLPGKYSFLDLKAWYDRMSNAVFGIPGVVMTDIDDAQNKLWIGVETPTARTLVEEQLLLLGIPREAVDIGENLRVIFDSSLRDIHRPLLGGLLITFMRGLDEFGCTLGFNAIREGVPGFVTASHCTADPGGVVEPVEPTVFYQPSSPSRIGEEAIDPRYLVTHAIDPSCPENHACRYSDSAFVKRDAGVEADLGFVAKPALNIGQEDPDAWNEVDRFRILTEEANIMIA